MGKRVRVVSVQGKIRIRIREEKSEGGRCAREDKTKDMWGKE